MNFPDPDFAETLPDKWTPLEAVLIVKCLDADGDITMWHSATPGLNTYEALGMTRWTELRLERGVLGLDDEETA